MKKLIFILFGIPLLFACNNHKDEQSKTVNIPQQEKDLIKAIETYPDSFLLKENLVQYYRDNGNYGQAIAETEKFIIKDSSNDRLWDIVATLHFENGDTTKAIYSFEKAIAITANPEYIMSLGSLYAQTRNPMALTMADALLKANKARAEVQALFIKGLYYSYTNDKSKAIGFFDNCLMLDYTNMFAYREKAICFYDMGKYVDALKVLEKAVTVQNNYAEGYYWMGRCYEKIDERNAAIESYNTALEFDKEYPEAKDALAKLGVK